MHIGTDRRLFERIEVELAVRYSPQGSDREFCTTTKNISGGGIRISLLKKLEPGTLLDLEVFKYDTDIKARCRGKVAWAWDEPMFEAGIQFIDTKLFHISRLIDYLENQK